MKAYLRIAGAVFGIYALFHFLRLLLGWPAQVSNWAVPLWASAAGLLLNGGLSLWALRLPAKIRRGPDGSAAV
jgi:hypothetical protein